MKKSWSWIVGALLLAAQGFAANNCLTFDGTNDWVNTAAVIPVTGNFTVECWAKCETDPGTYKEILSQGSSGNAFYMGTDTSGHIRVGDGWVGTGVAFPFGDWHHFAVVASDVDTVLYIDGQVAASLGSRIPNPALNTPLRLGCQYMGIGEFWPGSIDEVRVWSGVRTAEEVRNNMGLLGSETGEDSALLVRFSCDQSSDSSLIDSGPSAYVANLKNMNLSSCWETVVSVELDQDDETVDWNTATYAVSGSNSVSAASLSWTNAANGASEALAVSGLAFEVASIPLEFGTNAISVIGTTDAGMLDIDSVQVVREDVPDLVIDITTSNQTVAWSIETIELNGTNNVSVISLTWTNTANGAAGAIQASNLQYQISSIPLAYGTNLISVIGENAQGIQAADQVQMVREAAPLAEMVILTTNQTIAGERDTIDLVGTNNQWIVGTMVWTNAANAESGEFQVSGFTFQISSIPLCFGTNTIALFGSNIQGIAVSDTVTITRSVESGADNSNHYVSPMGNHTWPFDSWTSAATNIQDAVDVAANGDTVWVGDGTYGLEEEIAVNKPITLRSLNGPSVTTINGDDLCRGLYCSTNAVIAGLSVEQCYSDQDGGGVYLAGGGMLTNCWIRNCSADSYGGGVCVETGTLSHCQIWENYADYEGGGVMLYGGTLDYCTIASNEAESGGGICVEAGTLNRCQVKANYAYEYGGGIGIYGEGELVGCVISKNQVWDGQGGGIYASPYGSEKVSLYNCTIVGNEIERGTGGGIYSDSTNTIQNCIIWNNTTSNILDNCDGSFEGYTNTCSLPAIGANSITNNPLFAHDYRDLRLRGNSPCVDAGQTESWMGETTDLQGISRVVNTVVDLGAYEYHALQPFVEFTNVPAVVLSSSNTLSITLGGTNNAAIVGIMNWTNQATGAFGQLPATESWNLSDISLARGSNEVVVTGTNINGLVAQDWANVFFSDEHAGDSPQHYVSTTGSSEWPFDSWATAANNLQDAIDAAMERDEVWIAEGVYYPSSWYGFALKRGVHLYGGFSGSEQSRQDRDWENHITVLSGDMGQDDITNSVGLIVSAEAQNGFNCQHVLNGSAWWDWDADADTESYVAGIVCSNIIDGVSITGADGGTSYGDPKHGGGICITSNDWLLIRNCTIQGNKAADGYRGSNGNGMRHEDGTVGVVGANGGGLYVNGGQVEIVNTYIIGNAAGTGGNGGDGGDTFVTDGGPGAIGGFGGGVYLVSAQGQLQNCKLYGNRAGAGGTGGEGGDSSSWGLGNGSYGGVGGSGGALYLEDGQLEVVGCIISGNSAGTGGAGARGGECSDNDYTSTGGNGGNGGAGGGVAYAESKFSVENTVMAGNTSGSGGSGGTGYGSYGSGGSGGRGGHAGAIFAGQKGLQMVNCTVVENATALGGTGGSVTDGNGTSGTGSAGVQGTAGALYCVLTTDGWVANSIICSNSGYSATGLYLDADTNTLTVTHSVLATTACGGSDATRISVYETDPQLDSGYAPVSNSICINAGDNDYVATDTDLAGNIRIFDGTVDIGAYEVVVGTDTDGDGIPDEWETRYFDSVLDCVTNAYSDGDTLNNWQEYIAGTDPTDGASYFHVTNCASTADGYLVEWKSVSGRVYSVWYTDSLTNDFTQLTNNIAYPASSCIINPDGTNGFFRMEVELEE